MDTTLVKIAEEAQVAGDQEIVGKGIGVTQRPVLRHDVAAVGHHVGGKDQPCQVDTVGEADQSAGFLFGEKFLSVDYVEKIIVDGKFSLSN